MIDTAGTLVAGGDRAWSARAPGASWPAASTPSCPGPAIERIKASPIEEIVVTNSIPVPDDKRLAARITVLTVAPLLGEAIRRIHDEESVSTTVRVTRRQGVKSWRCKS